MTMIRSIKELLEKAESLPSKTVAIAAAHDDAALSAAVEAKQKNIADAILVGIKGRIEDKLSELGAPKNLFEIIDREDDAEAVAEAVRLIRDGRAHVLLKGKVKTGTLIKGVLDREKGLRTGRLLSDVFIFNCPIRGQNRIIGITDGGLNLLPDLKQKAEIIQNAVEAFHRLGYEEPKVAVLSAVEAVNPDLQSTVDAAELAKMYKQGEFKGCVVDGPLAMDLAISEEAARIKGFESQIAGKADILVFPNIESANITAKALMYMIPFEPSHVIVGATAPVLIPSRSDSSEAKLNAVAFGCIAAHRED